MDEALPDAGPHDDPRGAAYKAVPLQAVTCYDPAPCIDPTPAPPHLIWTDAS